MSAIAENEHARSNQLDPESIYLAALFRLRPEFATETMLSQDANAEGSSADEREAEPICIDPTHRVAKRD
jgi:hypothetical protein